MPHADTGCDRSGLADEDDMHIAPQHDDYDEFIGLGNNNETDENIGKSRGDAFLTIRQRRQIKLGIRKVKFVA